MDFRNRMTNQIPELLLPAGNLHKLKIAYQYGADAAYCGVPRYSLRARENEFSLHNLKDAVDLARHMGKKIYFTVNAIPRNSKIPSFPRYIDTMAELNPDGLIMADPGLILITKERCPNIPIHISVQTNTMNYAAVKFWQQIGAKRVILSREVSIPEIAEIKQRVPDMEIEVFVHGAICIAHSGRCLMSNYFKGRDANQGACNNACRDQFKVYVTNPRQNDEFMELIEDSDGTYLMNSKDLRAIEYLKELTEAGVDSIKVEGRTKNDYYVGMVARTYRKALDDLKDGKPFDENLLKELDKISNRGYFTGFLTRGMDLPNLNKTPHNQDENYVTGASLASSHIYAGLVIHESLILQNNWAQIHVEIKTKLKVGDILELYSFKWKEPALFHIKNLIHKNKEHLELSGGLGNIEIKGILFHTSPIQKDLYSTIPENSFLVKPIHQESYQIPMNVDGHSIYNMVSVPN